MVSSGMFRAKMRELQIKHGAEKFDNLPESHPDIKLIRAMADRLSNRSVDNKGAHVWTEEQVNYIKEQYYKKTIVEMSKDLDLTIAVVQRKAASMFPKRRKGKRVRMLDAERNILGEWQTVMAVSKETGVHHQNIYRACKLKKAYQGMTWEYI